MQFTDGNRIDLTLEHFKEDDKRVTAYLRHIKKLPPNATEIY